MIRIENLQNDQTVTLPSGFTGFVTSVTAPLPGSTLREVVVVDPETGQPAMYLGRVGDELATP